MPRLAAASAICAMIAVLAGAAQLLGGHYGDLQRWLAEATHDQAGLSAETADVGNATLRTHAKVMMVVLTVQISAWMVGAMFYAAVLVRLLG